MEIAPDDVAAHAATTWIAQDDDAAWYQPPLLTAMGAFAGRPAAAPRFTQQGSLTAN
jgi:hypothetical protein